MAYAVAPTCIGCGACEFACPAGAISQCDGYPVMYTVDPLACDDCDRCAAVCPVDALGTDPRWATCRGHGCPLSSRRYSAWECSIGERACNGCGGPLWRSGEGPWSCPACDRTAADGRRGASCPKPRQARRLLGGTGTAGTGGAAGTRARHVAEAGRGGGV